MLTENLLIVLLFVLRNTTQGLGSEPEMYRKENMKEATFNKIQGSSMVNHVIKNMKVKTYMECVFECLNHPSCQSMNYQTQGSPSHICQLNNDTLATKPKCAQPRPGFDYYAPKEVVVDPCLSSPCKNGGVCSTDVCGPSAYQCLNCSEYNTGPNCDQWTEYVASCKDIYEKTSHRKNMAYTFSIQGQQTDVFCHMTEITGCGTGGWTLAMKINGAMNTFGRSSSYWSNKVAYNLIAGKTGFDSMETKMPSFWGVSFSAICVGFTVNGVTNFATISYTANSLYDVIADGNERAVNLLGKSKWQSLIAGSSMQSSCNKEGFNLNLLRIGVISNNENNCITTDSFFGYGGSAGVSCGNRCQYYCNNGDKVIRALGYILVK